MLQFQSTGGSCTVFSTTALNRVPAEIAALRPVKTGPIATVPITAPAVIYALSTDWPDRRTTCSPTRTYKGRTIRRPDMPIAPFARASMTWPSPSPSAPRAITRRPPTTPESRDCPSCPAAPTSLSGRTPSLPRNRATAASARLARWPTGLYRRWGAKGLGARRRHHRRTERADRQRNVPQAPHPMQSRIEGDPAREDQSSRTTARLVDRLLAPEDEEAERGEQPDADAAI